MKIILKEDVFKLGSEGTVCEVKAGFARNYLLPKNFAVFADEHNIEIFRQKKRTIEKKRENKTKEAIELKTQLDKIKIDFLMRSNESGKLFHSVNNANIADELKKLGFSIERKRIDVPGDVLKNIGLYEVAIKLYEDINSTIKVEIKEELKQKKEMPSKKIEDVQQQNGA